jgi:hypothetical protein
MIYLTLTELLHVAERTLGPDYAVRDYGLLEARPGPPAGNRVRQGRLPRPERKGRGAAALHRPQSRPH